MISIQKQIFSILTSLGILVVITTSLIVNVSIKRHFELYVQNTVTQAGDVIVKILGDLYEEDGWHDNLYEEVVVKTYMGNFAISILNPNKGVIWGTTEQELSSKLKSLEDKVIRMNNRNYRFEDRPIYDKKGVLVGYARIGYYPSQILSQNDLQFQAAVNETAVWCGSIIIGCFTAAGVGISRLLTHHIYGIARTSMILANGNLSIRYTEPSKIKEIETLRYSMNYLAERLEKQDNIRKKLISDVSHEIRTPLHILQSNLEAMIDGIYPIDDEQMQVLYKEVVRFGKLLNNLDMLKNAEEEEEINVDKTSLNLNKSMAEVFNNFKIMAKEKKIKYYLVDVETQDIMINADKDSIKQLWMNILSNAFKFTNDGGEIKVTTAIKDKYCVITVADTGIGIAQEDLPYIFDRMYRGDKSREKYEGSGLGLTIVKKIVETHEGKISVESVQGEGSKVIILLPMDKNVSTHQNITNKVKSYMRLGIKN